MGKKDKDPIPNPANVANKDILQRLNFLYQASVYLTNLSQTPTNTSQSASASQPASDPSNPSDSQIKKTKRERQREQKLQKRQNRTRIRTTDELARAYADTMTMIGKKATVKMDPSIKRTLCRACKSVLIPGVTVNVQAKHSSSHRHALELECATCGFARSIPAPPRRAKFDPSSGSSKEHDGGAQVGNVKRVYPPLPLALRPDAGHVVFRGNEKVEFGNGVFAI